MIYKNLRGMDMDAISVEVQAQEDAFWQPFMDDVDKEAGPGHEMILTSYPNSVSGKIRARVLTLDGRIVASTHWEATEDRKTIIMIVKVGNETKYARAQLANEN
jgi:hypothetical protein